MAEAPHLLLVNPSAGGGRTTRLVATASAALNDGGVNHRIVMTTNIEHGRSEAREAVTRGERVIVMSGDGLIGQVGGELAETGVALGIIPGGRGNDFARVIGIPNDVEEAAGIIARGQTRTIDVGEAGGVRFLCIASCGFDSDANRMANESWMRGPLVYAYAGIRALIRWKPARFELTLDGEPLAFTGYTVAAANSKAYGGGIFLAPDAKLDDGLLDVVMTGDIPKLRFLAGLPGAFKGEHTTRPEVTLRRCRELRIDADRPFSLYGDGDPIAELPVTVRVLAGALDVIVPPSSEP
ncbi:MAG: diacylglycerol kinase family lipid kinase [Actinomycetota bacterium]|nr:diacylglycerol kinase family lipid kinase [Actinomycetota bacterium]